ncbi:MAG: T9SS type A sorting domain-containing protein [Bacteroidia bacterium]|nr:T9SS type A sorting domain-containing protein [Bacteroidia bacterium]MDW8347929.1 glycosyl hydrolase family 28-related protein [Bacteroidia bacterium]
MKLLQTTVFYFVSVYWVVAQVIPTFRTVDWQNTGYSHPIPNPVNIVNVKSFGAAGDGVTDDYPAIISAMNSLSGNRGVVFFPAGTYLIKNEIMVDKDSVIFRGVSSDSTQLRFDFNGATKNGFNIWGSFLDTVEIPITGGLNKGSTTLTVTNSAHFSVGDDIEIKQENGAWDINPTFWSEESVGHLATITAISGGQITINEPLRMDFDLSLNPRMRKVKMRKEVGIECMRIHKVDTCNIPTCVSFNISFSIAKQCWVKGVESSMSIGAHIGMGISTHISVQGCYIHHAFSYTGVGTRGYGVVLFKHTTACRIENNIFEHLRHAMMVKEGSNGNVFGYNYSKDPYRSEIPHNATGDISVHGHYPFCNLFEGNIVQNVIVDGYWGIAGPYNTFFRNRAELYGFLQDTSPVQENQNYVGNETTNTSLGMGLFFIPGTNMFSHGNNVKGSIIPAGTGTLTDTTYYLTSKPDYWDIPGVTWSIGIPNPLNSGTNPAKQRYIAGGSKTVCNSLLTSYSSQTPLHAAHIYPNPTYGTVYFSQPIQTCAVLDVSGRVLLQHSSIAQLNLEHLPQGIYFLSIIDNNLKKTHIVVKQ